MILHRLHVSNYRGISDVALDFSQRISVISGANEAGKSTLIEAFDALIDVKASSTKADLKRAQPVGHDVGPEVSAEFTIGDHRVRYTKRWLKDRRTELTFLDGPKKGTSLTGDQAHDAALELWNSIDVALWNASRMIQAGKLDQVALTDSTALQKALEHTAVSVSEESTPLLDAVREETSTFYSAGRNRESGELKKARDDLARITETHDHARQALARIESTVTGLADLEESLSQQEPLVAGAASDVADLSAQAEKAATARSLVDQAERSADSAAQDLERQQQRATTREELIDALELASTKLAQDKSDLDEITTHYGPQAEKREQATRERDTARTHVDQLKAQLADARSTNTRADNYQRMMALGSAITKADELSNRIAEMTACLPQVDRETLTQLEQIDRELSIAKARQESSATRIQIRATSDVEVDGSTVRDFDDFVTSEMTITVPGHADMTLTPPEAIDIDDVIRRHREMFTSAGFSSLQDAHDAFDTRQESLRHIDTLQAEKKALFESSEAEARSEFDTLSEAQLTPVERVDESQLVADLEDSESQARTLSALVDSLTEAHQETRTRIAELTGMIRSQESTVEHAQSALSRARAEHSDDEVTRGVTQAEAALSSARDVLNQRQQELTDLGGTHIVEDLEFATQRHAALIAQVRETESRIVAQRAVLESMERDRISDEYEQSGADVEYATRHLARLERRARAARRLEEVLLRHQADVHATYVSPYREALLGVARSFFRDPGMDITVGPDLTIESVTRAGRQVPFADLSTGTKEQFAILIRLATASLVARQDAVPIMLDDTLGYSDQKRLRHIVSLLDRISDGQVIIFTANAERFAGLTHATTLRV